MPSPFQDYGYKKAVAALSTRKRDKSLKAFRAFVMGDHWQEGKAWTGPRFPNNSALYSATMDEIEKMFTVENIVGEGVYRHADGTVGVEPAITIVPDRVVTDDAPITQDEQTLIDEAMGLLRAWANDRNVHEDYQHAVETLLWAGVSPVRLFIPRGMMVVVQETGEDGQTRTVYEVPRLPVEKSLDPVYINSPQPQDAIIEKDRDTQKEVGVYVTKMDNKVVAEIVFVDDVEDGESDEGGETRKARPATVVRVADRDRASEVRLDIGGRLLHYEMRRRAIVTEPICSLQRTLNKDLTMLSNHLTMAGFLERVLLNVELPFHMETDPETGKQVKVYDEMQVGAGTVNALQSVVYYDKEGVPHPAPASVHYKEPSSSDVFLAPATSLRTGILRQMSQLHVAMADDATAAAQSRIQARADYLVSLMRTASQVEAGGRWLHETALALAALFQGQPGKYESLRVDLKIRLDPGPIPPEEIDAVLAQVEKRVMSRRAAMAYLGREDPEAEDAQIEKESGVTPQPAPTEESGDTQRQAA